ncbi:hypothetical protein BJ165DRAFT_1400805 [Panaeolus papilionaceus]|nr:hypothetical protein BJ165DRAFT_1400805 [Panaeolus papilionaceus]
MGSNDRNASLAKAIGLVLQDMADKVEQKVDVDKKDKGMTIKEVMSRASQEWGANMEKAMEKTMGEMWKKMEVQLEKRDKMIEERINTMLKQHRDEDVAKLNKLNKVIQRNQSYAMAVRGKEKEEGQGTQGRQAKGREQNMKGSEKEKREADCEGNSL